MKSMEEMIQAAQKAAETIQKQMGEAQAKLDQLEVEGVSGGGLVKIRCSAKGRIIAVVAEGDDSLRGLAHDVVPVPETIEELSPLVNVVALQLFAYHNAKLRGADIDKPRNLAKSVTVE